jgi:hypothetical protein
VRCRAKSCAVHEVVALLVCRSSSLSRASVGRQASVCAVPHVLHKMVALLVRQEALEEKYAWIPGQLLDLPPPEFLHTSQAAKLAAG